MADQRATARGRFDRTRIGGPVGQRARPGAGVTSGGLDPKPLPEPGLVRLRAADLRDLGLVAELDGPVVPTGFGGVEAVTRPGRVGRASYQGRPPLGLTIPLLLDGWHRQRSVEAQITVINGLLGVHADAKGRESGRPPLMIVEGFGVPHSFTREPFRRWRLTGDPQYAEDLRRRAPDGHAVFVRVVLTAIEDPQPEATPVADERARQVVRVRKGSRLDTLRELARHHRSSWTRLVQLNPRLPADPDRQLRDGTRVRVR